MKNYFDLSGRVAVVTGASTGLGLQMAKAFASQGANLVLLARRFNLLEENAKAITDEFSDGDAAVKAFEAGCDMLLMPGDLKTSYNAVLEKIKSGEITEDRLHESLYRIIRAKLTL